MFRRIAVLAAAVSLTTFAIAADAAFTGADKGRVKIDAEAESPVGKFSGKLDGVDVKEQDGKLIFTTDLSSRLKMGLRDKHTRESFDIGESGKPGKGNKVTLTVDKSKLKIPADNEKASGHVKGDLSMRGASQPVDIKYTVSRTGSDYHIKEAKFTFDYTVHNKSADNKEGKICKMTVCVLPQVTVTVEGVKVRDK
jgi:hypothetical protein